MTIGPSDFIVAVEFIDSIECPRFIGFIKKEIHELFDENWYICNGFINYFKEDN